MISNREEIEQEARQRITRYYEEQKKFQELLSQFVSIGKVEFGKPIESPRRVFDTTAIKEIRAAEQKLDKLRQEMDEACNRLNEAYH